jgi:hypothetical protein
MSWNIQYPSNCPPSGAKAVDFGPVYRFVQGANISIDDFEPEISRKANNFKSCSNKNRCKACGVSIYSNLNEAKTIQNIVPRFKNCLIAEGKIYRSEGEILKTPSKLANSHITWWVKTKMPHANFKVIP